MTIYKDLFEKITERYSVPIKFSKNCEANTFYRVEDLTAEDVNTLSAYLAKRTIDVLNPEEPEILVEMPGSTIGLAQAVAEAINDELGKMPNVISLNEFNKGNGARSATKGKMVVIINDIITTGKSCLEAHSELCMTGAKVGCWLALIDRTFGPGPVSIVAAMTGDPVKLLD